MSTITYKRCDQCKVEVPINDDSLGLWYLVDRNYPRDWREAGHSERFDFCSLPCIGAWSRSRELIRAAS